LAICHALPPFYSGNAAVSITARQSVENYATSVSEDDTLSIYEEDESFVEKMKDSLPHHFPSLDLQKFPLVDKEGAVTGQANTYNVYLASTNRKSYLVHMFKNVDRKEINFVIRLGKLYHKQHNSNLPVCCAVLCQEISTEAQSRASKSNVRVVTN